MDEVSLNTEPVGDDDADGFEIEGDCGMTEYVGQTGIIQGENPLPPAVGMEFDSYDDVYYFYNCYAKEQGFGVRVSNTWYRKSKERYRGKLSCSSAGFKKKSEANRPRPETRTGCPAMIKFRLMDNRRWRIIEVELEHNHLISRSSGKFYKSHKSVGLGTKRTLQVDGLEETQKIRLFRTVIVDAEANGSIDVDVQESGSSVDYSNQLKLKEGDAQAVQNFFCRLQMLDPNFFYVVDLNEKGCLRNLFWADARSRVAYSYFGDVVSIDTTCLTDKYEVPLVLFIGVNHHGQSVLLGCGLLAAQTIESYTWFFRAWLTCMLGRPPQAIITDQCGILQTAIADVFPRASHCLYLSHIMQKVPEKLGGLFEYEAINLALSRAVYHSVKTEEFEAAWEDMVQRHGIRDHKWLQALYEDRKRWVPAYVKELFLAGMFPFQPSEAVSSFFEVYLEKQTPLKEFLDKYDQALQTHYQLEALADLDSRNSSFMLNSRCYFELQLSKLYTNDILQKFKKEVEGMNFCISTRQLNVDGPIVTYIVKEQIDELRREARDYEVFYNPSEMEVLCVCGVYNFRGYLCRHSLSVLNQNVMEEIPPHYILSRWRKDINRNYILDHSFSGIDVNNPVHRYDHLYKCIVQVVEEGRKSEERYKAALQSLDEILNKLRLMEEEDEQMVLEYRDRERDMKFKAFLTENGVNLLEKRFLPALDKMGKICHLYFTRDHAFFLHNLLNGDGIQSVAQFRKEALFDDYRISSQNEDRIAFAIDVSLFHRALRSSVSICTEFGGGSTENNRLQINNPRCTNLKTLSRAQLLELQTSLDMAQDLPQTLVQIPDLNQLQNFMDRMKHVGELLNVSISKYGDLHIQISTTLITLGAEFRKLLVIGDKADAPAEDANLSPQSRSSRAILRGDAKCVQVSVKHFAKSLQYHLAKPDCAFYGIAPQDACLIVIFQFFIPGSRQMDKSISLHCRLPVLDPGSS
ncbi:hypothetical protein FNV43_RR06995 [Rhamnella rubrinervis]|uniref:Protein FAR1-RELATED SEQUENCE n=1 Tax=Rhamnella rubrinervis TaxID=2594499 RepID=A0A8K0MLS9_9ROSA|nr:hypothetical protein FNV43_RR06995 [Rhamnella rubrinervis]